MIVMLREKNGNIDELVKRLSAAKFEKFERMMETRKVQVFLPRFEMKWGTGIVEIGDEKQKVSKDTLIEGPRDIMHCWYNESDRPVKFMVIKARSQAKKTVFVGG